MNKGFQKFCAWSGFISANIFFAGLLIGNIFPPMAPDMTAPEVQSFLIANASGIKIGGLLIIISGAFAVLFDAVILMQLWRMEGKRPIAAFGQFGSGIANIAYFVLPGVFLVALAFRPERDVDSLYAMFDLAWMVTLFPWTVGAFQCICVGIGILGNPHVTNVYPRWVGFFNIWIAVGMTTSSVIPFFKTGPFAWNGIVGFWIPAIVFGLWMMVMCWATLKAVSTDDGK